MAQIILNVELFAGRTNLPLNALDTQAAVHAAFPAIPPFGIRAAVLPNAQGRATLVCAFELPSSLSMINIIDSCWNLCDATEQEAVAITVNGVGHLFGPLAENWGSFDPSQFVGVQQ